MEHKRLIPPYSGPPEAFPDSRELPDGVRSVRLTDDMGCRVRFLPDIPYARRSGETQLLHLLLPWDPHHPENTFPLVVYIQGSAWHRQEIFEHLPHMIRVCEEGFAVAMVEYRPSDIAPFPAQIQDAKAAIRFLRIHAEEYSVDGDRIAVWGDSSGGHTALMTGITGDREIDPELYGEASCGVRCVVDWYGPTDIASMNEYPSAMDHIQPDSPEGYLIGRKNVLENPELAARTVPMHYLRRDIPTPPILILHGSRDPLVCFHQSCMLYEKLRALDKPVEMYKLEGAFHGAGGFNSHQALKICVEFLSRYLKEDSRI